MELDDKVKAAVRSLEDAIRSALGSSCDVVEAIEHLRALGYNRNLTLKLEIDPSPADERPEFDAFAEFDLTDDDRKTLQRMKIRFD